jgi:hypothetical protein
MKYQPPPCRALKCIEQGATTEWAKQRISTGFHVFARCVSGCQVKTQIGGIWAPKMWFTPAELEAMPLTDAEPLPTCTVCGVRAKLESHHLAPRELFGDEECERWPRVDVCRDCHERWHERIGQMINRKAAAE